MSGCVYLRLLDVKAQLAKFDQHVTVSEDGRGLTLSLKDPTLTEKDLLKLGVQPISRATIPNGEVWQVGMDKLYEGTPTESDRFDLHCQLTIQDGRLASAFLPRALLDHFPADFMVETVKALGSSKVIKLKKEIVAHWRGDREDLAPISLATVRRGLGAPYESNVEDGRIAATYRYFKKLPEDAEDVDSEKRTYHVTFTFDETGRHLLKANTRSINVMYGLASN